MSYFCEVKASPPPFLFLDFKTNSQTIYPPEVPLRLDLLLPTLLKTHTGVGGMTSHRFPSSSLVSLMMIEHQLLEDAAFLSLHCWQVLKCSRIRNLFMPCLFPNCQTYLVNFISYGKVVSFISLSDPQVSRLRRGKMIQI